MRPAIGFRAVQSPSIASRRALRLRVIEGISATERNRCEVEGGHDFAQRRRRSGQSSLTCKATSRQHTLVKVAIAATLARAAAFITSVMHAAAWPEVDTRQSFWYEVLVYPRTAVARRRIGDGTVRRNVHATVPAQTPQPKWICLVDWPVADVCIAVRATSQANRILTNEPPLAGSIVPGPVIVQSHCRVPLAPGEGVARFRGANLDTPPRVVLTHKGDGASCVGYLDDAAETIGVGVGECRAVIYGEWLVNTGPVDVLQRGNATHLAKNGTPIIRVAGRCPSRDLLDASPQWVIGKRRLRNPILLDLCQSVLSVPGVRPDI